MQQTDGFTIYADAFQAGMRPDPPLMVDEWSEEHMVIPVEAGAACCGDGRVAAFENTGRVELGQRHHLKCAGEYHCVAAEQ